MKRYALLVALCLASAAVQAKGLPYAIDSLEKAQQVSRQDAKPLLIFYTSENWAGCRYITGELSGGELKSLYEKDFAIFEADVPRNYPEGHELRKLTSRPYTPVFVFLDSSGRKIVETAGFRTPREAKALHEFVTKKHYVKTSWSDFLASYK